MASSSFITFNPLQPRQLFSFCKCLSTSIDPLSNSTFAFSLPKDIIPLKFSNFFLVKPPLTATIPLHSRINSSTETTDYSNISEALISSDDSSSGSVGEIGKKSGKGFLNNGKTSSRRMNLAKTSEIGSGYSSSRSNRKRSEREQQQQSQCSSTESGKVRMYEKRKMEEIMNTDQKVSGFSSTRTKDANSAISTVNGNVHRHSIKENISNNEIKVKNKEKLSKKSKDNSPEFRLRIGLDMCSKKGDVMGAISLYESSVKQYMNMGQYHYTVLLYLCSSAAMGVIQPAKSGSSSSRRRSVDELSCCTDETDGEDMKDRTQKEETVEIRVNDDVKKYALEKGIEIYERMCLEKVEMNEAALTSVARMAMAMGNGDMAFDTVKQMKSMGINPKLRSYGPALSAFSSNGDIDKAFAVEKHMLENGVHPEEPELEALLTVSIETGKADRVYYLLHKLRTSVRFVSRSTAALIEKWFKSKEASRVGKRKWDPKMIAQIMENVGGGWHGQGWLGRGKWNVIRTCVETENGLCKCCGEKLALIDLDPEETEKFAESVASLALKREKKSSFQKFQRWLDYYGPFEAVVDAANVGLLSQRTFKPSKVNVVVNGIRQRLPSRKWPLIILHNRRLTGSKMDETVNRGLVDRWRNADALYATPTGSNDDWYWLYAAIKFKCLLVTNDEMRDHTFQLLGTDFFPKWKERHQVRFNFSEIGPVFHMPPPCSVVIQESERGHWHIPVASEHQSEGDRLWLCISRPNFLVKELDHGLGANSLKDSKQEPKDEEESGASKSEPRLQVKARTVARSKRKAEEQAPKHHTYSRNTLSGSISSSPVHIPIWEAIEAAEKLVDNVIDFQI